jgi:SAM-dependent methyltransferase
MVRRPGKRMSEYEVVAERERSYWNQRYGEPDAVGREPDEFLVRAYADFLRPAFPASGDALDLAGGAGRHALFLAEKGWRVTLADISEVALERALAQARELRLPLDVLSGDTHEMELGRERFDLALGFFYLDRDAFPKIAAALRPGGFVVYKTFTIEHAKYTRKGPSRAPYFLYPLELQKAFPDFEVLFYDENVSERGIARLVARKPA